MNIKNNPQLKVEQCRQNIALIQQKIAHACQQSCRDVSEVRLLPVSKTVDKDILRLFYQAGCRHFGENKVQEAWDKYTAMADLTDLNWSIIGHLQTNKAKYVAKFASEFQALDNLRIAAELDKRLQIEGRSLNVLVQVNTSAEESKFGLPPEQVLGFVKELPAFSALKVQGLMTLAIFSADKARVKQCFVKLRQLRDELRQAAPAGLEFNQLSMGMSGDFELAIAEGATIVRVGQAIFGQRIYPDSYYWPK